ncbi:MAG TPA: hypothetical protein PLF48_03880 [Chitinophagales bacterium]|nr:hypothetical protein [Chitinophagales bacterium]
MSKQNWINTLLFILIGFIFLYFLGVVKRNDINKNAAYSCGKIYDYYEDTKGHSNILFKYYVEKKEYTYMYVGGNFKDCEKTGWCIGKCFVVQYSSKNPENSTMHFDKPCNCDSLNVDIP